ncbi:MAG: NAD(P)/FAD-dependent oxidoreductase [Chloroflexota bacterium]|nr:NAD(P)/FAD-dependent oxidoreductase [Chloroflexota bacterium]
MAISRPLESIVESDDALRQALKDAFLPALLPALAQATGDLSYLRDDLRSPGITPGIEQGGMTPAQQESARELALKALRQLRDGAAAPAARRLEEDLRAILNWMTNSKASDEYIPLMLEELAPSDDDPRAPAWRMELGTEFTVAIIGAGMSGILAAIRLKQAGVPFVILEKNADVGGTWFENVYPGARVDVPSAFYSYSFAQKVDWPKYFSPQNVLLDYFRACADDYGIRDQIRFGTEVRTIEFDDERLVWTLRIRTPGGAEETIEAQAVISAVGQLNRPNIPDIPGRDDFAGPAFHSARWDHSVDLKGKRVAVIGTGASAAQFVPAIAPDVAELNIFQRTPNWFVPVPTYHDDVPQGLQWLLRHVPHYAHWYRFWMFWSTTDGLLPAATVDDGWQHKDRSVSAENDVLRMILTGYIQAQFADRPDLLEKVLPSYPPASKRIILDNGAWASTIKRDNVHLITDPIARITPNGVVTSEGTEHQADAIIYGTGFHASRFLTPMKVVGRHGTDLFAQWDGDARAYMGVVVPNFPNFFMLYGPNTNIVVNGSIIYFSECEVQYVMGCLRLLIEGKRKALDCKTDVHDEYNGRIDEGNRKRAWGVGDVHSWYKNDRGRVSQNWPFNVIEFWQQTRAPSPNDFTFL